MPKTTDEKLADARERYAKNPEPYKERAAAWAARNPERRREIARDYARKARAEGRVKPRARPPLRPPLSRAELEEREIERRRRARLKRYGLTPNDFDRMLAEQGGVCAICSGPPGQRSFHVDHDAATGRVRGLLCGNCNRGIGNLKHDPDILVAAAIYLARAEV